MNREWAIQAEGISKAYGTGNAVTPVLHDIDLSVVRGECLFLVGPSGSDKTTLLSILGCVLSADRGRLELLGRDVTRLKPNAHLRFRSERIGFVFQRFHLFDGLKAWEISASQPVSTPNQFLAVSASGRKSVGDSPVMMSRCRWDRPHVRANHRIL